MWTYKRVTGELLRANGTRAGFGFAGNGVGLNAPIEESTHMVGPLPEGSYTMSAWIEKHPTMGLCVIALTPDPKNEMFGRAGFFIHGAVALDTGGLAAFLKSSDGCICFRDCVARRGIWNSADRILQVV